MVEHCWDRMHPASPEMDEDADIDDRCGPFDWISEDSGGARFPPSVRAIPLVQLDGKTFGLIDWKLVQDGRGVGKDTLDKAVSSTSREDCKETLDQLTATLEAFAELSNRLGEVMGSTGPGLSDLRAALGEVYGMSQQILKEKGPAEEEPSEVDDTGRKRMLLRYVAVLATIRERMPIVPWQHEPMLIASSATLQHCSKNSNRIVRFRT